MAAESKGISEVTEINEIEAIWEAQEAEEISERETAEVEEIKEAKGLEKSANQPLSDSPLIAESKGASSALKLPSGPLRHVFSFFTPRELARMSTVSKGFLSSANERNIAQNRRGSITSRELSFGLNENMAIDRQIRQAEAEAAEANAKEFKAETALPFTALHRTLLRSWYQETPFQQ